MVGGPIGAVVGGAGAAGGAVIDEGVDEKIGEATASEATAGRADVLEEIKGWDEFSNDQSARVVGDIPADNGVIHAIDSVLMTKNVRDLLDGQRRG